jgi:hypothetical protein
VFISGGFRCSLNHLHFWQATSFQLLIYDTRKQHICAAPITSDFQCRAEADNYISFTDNSKGDDLNKRGENGILLNTVLPN